MKSHGKVCVIDDRIAIVVEEPSAVAEARAFLERIAAESSDASPLIGSHET